MKQIVYRGGIVNFRIPNSWLEEYEPDGGGTFYEDSPDSGTMRLNVITFESPDEITVEAVAETFKNSKRGDVAVLPNGNVVQKYTKSVTEDEEELLIYYWDVGNPVPPRSARVALFSYTILASQATDGKFVAELKMLNEEIAAAKFASILGV